MGFRSDIGTLILGALQAGPLHGYQIVRRLRESGGVEKLSEGQIYPYLHRLERDGQVSSEWQTDTGAAPRKVYELTESGLKELDHQRVAWAKFSTGIGSILSSRPAKPEGGNA